MSLNVSENSTDPSLTGWFPGTVLPVRTGVYLRYYTGKYEEGLKGERQAFSFFDAETKKWHVGFANDSFLIRATPEADAAIVGVSEFRPTQFKWRGITHEASQRFGVLRSGAVHGSRVSGGRADTASE